MLSIKLPSSNHCAKPAAASDEERGRCRLRAIQSAATASTTAARLTEQRQQRVGDCAAVPLHRMKHMEQRISHPTSQPTFVK